MASVVELLLKAKDKIDNDQFYLIKEAFKLNPVAASRSFKHHFKDLYQSLPQYKSPPETIFRYLHPERCQRLTCHCGKALKFHNPQRGYGKFCSTKCSAISEEVRQGCIETVLSRYGVAHVNRVKSIKEKTEKTNLEKYGNKCSAQSKEISELRNKILIQNREVISFKRKETNLSRFGIEIPLQREEIKSKTHKINKALFKERRDKSLSKMPDLEFVSGDPGEEIMVRHTCGHEFSIGPFISEKSIENRGLRLCPQCHPRTSKPEAILVEHLKKNSVSFELHNRDLIKPYELDIVFPEKKLAIEVNGIYWHQESSRSLPLITKYEMAKIVGYRVLHFWDFEITDKEEIVQKLIFSNLGLSPKCSVSDCEFKEISTMEAKFFLEKNHLQGYVKGVTRFGLTYKGELKACAIFAKSKIKKGTFNLLRFATDGTTIEGGLSRMVSEFKTKFKVAELISYVDLRYAVIDEYLENGWLLEGQTKPRQFWYCQKSKSILFEQIDLEKTNVFKAIDCGSLVFVHK